MSCRYRWVSGWVREASELGTVARRRSHLVGSLVGILRGCKCIAHSQLFADSLALTLLQARRNRPLSLEHPGSAAARGRPSLQQPPLPTPKPCGDSPFSSLSSLRNL